MAQQNTYPSNPRPWILSINSLHLFVTELGVQADRARPGTSGLPDFDQPGPLLGVPGQVYHRRPTGPDPAPPTAVTEPIVTLVRSATFTLENTHWGKLSAVTFRRVFLVPCPWHPTLHRAASSSCTWVCGLRGTSGHYLPSLHDLCKLWDGHSRIPTNRAPTSVCDGELRA